MIPVLIPEPHVVRMKEGFFTIPVAARIFISDPSLEEAAVAAKSIFKAGVIIVEKSRTRKNISISFDTRLKKDGYNIFARADRLAIRAFSSTAAVNAVRTLIQICEQRGDDKIPAMDIDDWPDFADRGVYYDVTRGRIPLLERLKEQVELLARFKINQYQLYIEHTFLFPRNPDISEGTDPLTAEDILDLDRLCRKLHVELVPSLASFGHMHRILSLPAYRHMAEDRGVGKYDDPAVNELPAWQRHGAWTISPANPDTYKFLDSLFAQFLPLFTSRRFNVCCDETWDLGYGQTMALCRKKGKGRVYLDHILRLRRIAAKYGKKIMFWGDIIKNYPELLKEIPRDVTLLEWGYGHRHFFDSMRKMDRAGLNFYACPGTSSWVSLFPRLHESRANIREFARAGRKYGATGLLNTDWGDGGHYNFMELSWYGYLFGAEQAWNPDADMTTFTRRFLKLFLRCGDTRGVQVIHELADISHISVQGHYQSVWLHIFFAKPDSDLFIPRRLDAWVSSGGSIRRARIVLNRRFADAIMKKLEYIRTVLSECSRNRYHDPHGLLPYWLFSVDAMIHAAKKLSVLSSPSAGNRPAVKSLADEMNALKNRFVALWRARNRESEIRISLGMFNKAIKALETCARKLKGPTTRKDS